MATIQQLLDRAVTLAAQKRGEAPDNTAVDADAEAEVFWPHAARHVVAIKAKDRAQVSEVMVSHDLALIAGVAVLPPQVAVKLLEHSYMPDFQFSHFLRQYQSYGRYRFDTQITYYAVSAGNIYVSGNLTATKKLVAPSIPVLPALATDPITYPDQGLNSIVETIAMLLTGDLTLDKLETF